MKKQNLFFVIALTAMFLSPLLWRGAGGEVSAQNIGINATGATPAASAGLDVDFNNKGLLIPRLTTAQATTLAATAAEGLMIFNITTKCFQIFIGTAWQNIFCGCTAAPAAAGTITGCTPVYQNQTGVAYSVGVITGATGYVWSYTGTGFTIASGNNTNSITANFSASATSGNLTVYGTNACGNGTTSPVYPISVTSSPVIFSYTGAPVTWPVPCGVTSITIEAMGGQGANGAATGALGGKVSASSFTVTPGEILNIYVGGAASTNTGGWNGGGNGGDFGNPTSQGGGGGASEVRRSPYGLSDKLIVAGGGGGGGSYNTGGNNSYGGAGGGTGGGAGGGGTGANGAGGGGGTQLAGGAGGAPGAGAGTGGTGTQTVGGGGGTPNSGPAGGAGGGGGYWGGGGGGGGNGSLGGGGGGGGGGSSYTIPSATGVTHTQGFQSGNGQVTITW